MTGDKFVCQNHKAVEDKTERNKDDIDLLWAEVKKRLPIWVFTLFAFLTFSLMALQYHKSGSIEAAVNLMGTDIAVIKTELKHFNGRKP